MDERNGMTTTRQATLLDYLIIVLKWKRLVAGVCLAITLLAAAVVLLQPPIYRAETRIMPPDGDYDGTAAQLLGQLSGNALPAGFSARRNMSDLYTGLLRSRTVLDRVVDRAGLCTVYAASCREDARLRLLKALQISNDRKSGLISIAVEDRSAERAAQLAGYVVEELTRLTQEVAMSEAAQRRRFYEGKLRQARDSLLGSEEAMKGYQLKTGTIEMKEQAKAIIESVARLRSQIAAKEVDMKVLKSYAMPQNPDLQKSEAELKGMKEQLVRLEGLGGRGTERIVSAGGMLEAGTGYVRKVRDLKYTETIFELLARQYEMAKLDESRNGNSVQVIDAAAVPERRLRPKRARTIAIAALTGAVCGILAAFGMEKRERWRSDPEYRIRLAELTRLAGGPRPPL